LRVREGALITGADRGIGFEVSRKLGRFGYQVVLTSPDRAKGAVAADKLRGEGLNVVYRKLDLLNERDIRLLKVFVLNKFGRIDILVNNSGVMLDSGRSIIEVGKEALNADELLNLESFIKKMDFNDSGTAILLFPAKGEKPKKEMKLLAFAHLNGENELYSVIVTERLSALTDPIHRNLRDMLMLIGLFLLYFRYSAIFFTIFRRKGSRQRRHTGL